MFKNLKGDLFGGLTASIIALPLALAFGIVAFSPLGPEFASKGALACLYGAIFTSFFASLFGGTPTQVTGPTGPMSVIIATLFTTFIATFGISGVISNAEFEFIFPLVLFTVALGGVFQILLGVLGGGKLIKYIPYPVIAGFMNGVAIIIFTSQVKPFLGLKAGQTFWDIFTGNAIPAWHTVLVGLVTIAFILLAPRLIKSIPGSLIGMIGGIACFFIIGFIAKPELLQSDTNPYIIGYIPTSIPKPTMALKFLNIFSQYEMKHLLMVIIPAITLGMLGAIDSLLTSLVADLVSKTRHNSKKELIGQGVGNIVSPLFGGLAGAGSTVRTLVNYESGGRTRLSGMICGLTVLLVLLVLGQYAKWVPYAVLAGILMVTSTKMVDTYSFELIKRKSTLKDLAIVLIVAGTTVLVSLMVAVGIGFLITALLFIKDQMTRSVIKNRFHGNQIHSKKVRSIEEMEILKEKGKAIVVYHLDGAVFFGTADKLLLEIESIVESVETIILDFKMVREIDITGIQIIKQLNENLRDSNKKLALSYIDYDISPDKDRMTRLCEDLSAFDNIGRQHFFPDTDSALEWAEDMLIKKYREEQKIGDSRVELKKMNIFEYLSDAELDKVSALLTHCTYKAGDEIFHEGEKGDTMYLVSKGSVNIFLELGKGERHKRIASFGEGVFFGDMSLLEEKPRSATAIAGTDTEVYCLTKKNFHKLLEEEPAVASRIQLGIARELSKRLRVTSDEVRALEV
jgi:SulP family sulfate permease